MFKYLCFALVQGVSISNSTDSITSDCGDAKIPLQQI